MTCCGQHILMHEYITFSMNGHWLFLVFAYGEYNWYIALLWTHVVISVEFLLRSRVLGHRVGVLLVIIDTV